MREDSLSFAEFQVLRAGIRERKDVLMIGIDVAKRNHMACFCGPSRRILVRSYPFSNSRSGFEEFGDVVSEVRESHGLREVVVGLESTGMYQKPLEDFLWTSGYHLVSVSNLASARNRQTIELSWNKSDRTDAEGIADLLCQGKFLYHPRRAGDLEDARRLLRYRLKVMREVTRCLVRMQNSILPVVFPELADAFSGLDGELALRVLEEWAVPREIAAESIEAFLDRFRGLRGKFPGKKLTRIHALAEQSIGSERGLVAYRLQLRDLVQDIRRLKARLCSIDHAIQNIFQDDDHYQNLQSIPGIGPMIAATLLSEIGPIEHFRTAQQVTRFAGLNIVGKQSGEYQGIGVISKMGNSLLRTALYHAALAASRSDSPLGQWYKTKTQAPSVSKKKILVALARKILRIAFRMMKQGTPYRENYDSLLRIKQRHREVMAKLNKKTA
jgi:transposase